MAYDLVGPEADYPPFEGPPQRSIIVASHPRSGSTLVGELLHAAGGLGCPLEYLHVGFRPAFQARWRTASLEDYIAALHTHRTTPDGTFGLKLFWRDVTETLGRPEEDVVDYQQIFSRLVEICPSPVFIHLYRRDRIRAAVSAYVASQTGVFRAVTPDSLDRSRQPVPFDHEAIEALIAGADKAHMHWRNFFRSNDIQAYSLAYESLDRDFEQQAQALLRWLGRDAAVPRRRLMRQSDRVVEQLVGRWLAEATGRASASTW